ncbi:Cof-type HAD-IIB family hydrolase [Streptococcus lutetiensis]|uniref:Cof-type HAD-IIB family hydrolase n=1 Tax=Streptococcus lutetiensis TaxID=150055 RepID=UPI001BD9CDC5|nr:Cof-type HAD-IIB family hydrolase [Streptococcus lutetiensis]MBT0891822.1 Cof-type HAD-IIB family hydrolase [Streptococcus lutetiensis]
MTIKVIATDMDGTFLTNNKTYDKVLFNRLFDKFMADDIKFVVASGNQYRQIIQQFPEHKHQMTFVAENGGHIIENGRTLQEEFETVEAISALVNYIEKHYPDTVINLAGKASSYLPKSTPKKIKDLLSYYLPVLKYVDNLHPIPDDDYFKVTLLVRDELTFQVRDEINTLFADYQLTATSSGFGCIDVIPSHVHKGTGLDFLLNHWGYGPENLMVFGDGGNDIEMLKLAKYSFAMANAPQEIKNVASYQAPSNQENGVLQVLANHFLNEGDS